MSNRLEQALERVNATREAASEAGERLRRAVEDVAKADTAFDNAVRELAATAEGEQDGRGEQGSGTIVLDLNDRDSIVQASRAVFEKVLGRLV